MAQQESYQGLARKWRPQRFEDLVGQESVAQSFQSALRQGRVVHGHLLAGPRGVGKTTSARILAKALNCEQGPSPTPCGQCRHCLDIAAGNDMDVIEIDAASNTGVDNIRELRERVIQAPFAARYKVYIIDEIHMLSTGAFNALLKTLEEPPPQVIFIFATTEMEKVPETIRSRCVVHNFRRLSAEDIARRLEQVAQGEGVTVEAATAREIYGLLARSVEGGMRDALVAFDQIIALTEGKPDVESTIRLLGLANQAALTQTVGWLADGNAVELLKLIEDLIDRGRSLERYVKSLTAYLRDLMLLQATGSDQLVALSGEALAAARAQARQLAPATLYNILNQMFELEAKLKQSSQARFLIEFTFLRIATVKPVVPIDEIMRRVKALPESALGTGPAAPTAAPAPAPPTLRPAQAASAAPEMMMPPVMMVPAMAAPMAVLCDSAPPAAAAKTPDGGGTGGADAHDAAPGAVANTVAAGSSNTEEILEMLVPQLPDASRFLGRYLRQAVGLRLEGGGLKVLWPRGDAVLARKMIEKPENTNVIETTLAQVYGRPMRLSGEEAEGEPPAPAESGKPEPGTRNEQAGHPSMMRSEALFNDSSTAWASGTVDEAGEVDLSPTDDESDEEGGKENASSAPPAAPSRPEPAAQAKEEKPIDRRNALQKAQAFLGGGEDAVRRVRLLKDMLSGRIIDESGQPLPI